MFQKILIVFISAILLISCGGKKEAKVETQIRYDEVYNEALAAINGEYFFASNKFQEIQLLTSNREGIKIFVIKRLLSLHDKFLFRL